MSGACEVEIVGLDGEPEHRDRAEPIRWRLQLSRYPTRRWRECWVKFRGSTGGLLTPVPSLEGDRLVVSCYADRLEADFGEFRRWVRDANRCCRESTEWDATDAGKWAETRREAEELVRRVREEIDL